MSADIGRLAVSVVLPVYFGRQGMTQQQAEELERAVASVIGQEYPDRWEVLLVDDGNVREIGRAFEGGSPCRHPNVRILRVPVNSGLVNALNLGLARARHPLVARIDADDAWRPTKIAQQLARFREDPELSLVATGMTLRYQSGEAPRDLVRRDGWTNILEFSRTEGCPFPHGSVVARRDVYHLLGGYSHSPAFRHAEDFELWSRWIRFFRPAMIESCLYDYSVTDTSVSGLNSGAQREASGRIHERILAFDDARDLPRRIDELAALMDLPVLATGAMLFLVWKYRPAMYLVPPATVDLLRKLLPDRRILECDAEGAAPVLQLLERAGFCVDQARRSHACCTQGVQIF